MCGEGTCELGVAGPEREGEGAKLDLDADDPLLSLAKPLPGNSKGETTVVGDVVSDPLLKTPDEMLLGRCGR